MPNGRLLEDLTNSARNAASRRDTLLGLGIGALAGRPTYSPLAATAKKKGKKKRKRKPAAPRTPRVRVASGEVVQDRTITALCEEGEVAVGGGFESQLPYNLVRSAPSPDTEGAVPTGWATRITVSITRVLTVYVICVPE